jgi:hypothetical protein
MYKFRLKSIEGLFSILRLPVNESVSLPQLLDTEIVSITKTLDEISVVCRSDIHIPGAEIDPDWRAMRISGQLDTSLVGILYRLTEPLYKKGISVFIISTFDTDYLLVKRDKYLIAVNTLNQQEGITVDD